MENIIIVIIMSFIGIILWKSREVKKFTFKKLSLKEIDKMDGFEFEHYVAKLLSAQGFKAEVTPGSNDYGVDIVAKKNNDKFAIQVKRYSSNVSRKAVSDAVAGMRMYDCNKSMVVTNSYYTKGAQELARVNYCKLVDRSQLKKWIT